MPKVVSHEARRRSMIEASWEVIAREGMEGVTLRKVAAEAECTTGRITHYFSNRDDLIVSALRAVYGDSERRMRAIQDTVDDPETCLRRIVYEALPLDKSRLREWRVWVVFWAAATSNEAFATENARRFKTWQQLLGKLISDCSGASQTKQLAFELASLIDGIGIRVCLSPNSRTRAIAQSTVDEWLKHRELYRESVSG